MTEGKSTPTQYVIQQAGQYLRVAEHCGHYFAAAVERADQATAFQFRALADLAALCSGLDGYRVVPVAGRASC